MTMEKKFYFVVNDNRKVLIDQDSDALPAVLVFVVSISLLVAALFTTASHYAG
jgi:hypothetical protein